MEETPQAIIPDSFDDFIKENPPENKDREDTMEVRFAKERVEWTEKVKNMSTMMRKIVDTAELMTTLYTERQRGVEYYHYLLTLLSKINKTYRKQYAEKFDFYTYQTQKRFPNERSKEIQIMADLAPTISLRDQIENHSKFIDKTVGTMDNIIFGIKSRVEIEQILRGK
jgi:hypothetical protein